MGTPNDHHGPSLVVPVELTCQSLDSICIGGSFANPSENSGENCQVLEEKLLGTGSDAPPRDHTDGDRTDAVDGMPEPLPLTVAKVGDRTALS